MWNRDFDPDSSSSFDDDEVPGTPPGDLKGLGGHDDDFHIDPYPQQFFTRPASQDHHLPQMQNEKVGFINYPENTSYMPQPETNPNVRPPSSSAQMRAKMQEANRAKLLSRGGTAVTVSAKEDMIGKPSDSDISSILYSNQIYNNNDLKQMRDFRNLGSSDINFQPSSLGNRDASIPQPIRADPTVFKDDLDEEVLGEGSKNPYSQPNIDMLAPLVKQQVYQPPPPPVREPIKEPVAREPVVLHDEPPPKAPIANPYVQVAEPLPRIPEMSRQERPPEIQQKEQLSKEAPQGVEDRRERPGEEETKNGNPPREEEGPRRPIVNTKEVIMKAMVDMRKFLTSPAPREITIQCTIRREKSGFARMYPKYFMHLSDGWEFLLAAKKRGANKTSNYMITMSQREFSKKSPHYLAKVRSNFMGTEFHTYDTGLNPKDRKANNMNSREELLVTLYQSNILGTKGPRKMRVIVPAVNAANDRYIWKPMRKEEGILENYKKGNTNGMQSFYNKPPKWSEHVQAFVLNFNGRVDRASVKNFQLVDDDDDSHVYLQFGRVGDSHFNIDYTWPFSPIQAFAVALTSFDNKFACE